MRAPLAAYGRVLRSQSGGLVVPIFAVLVKGCVLCPGCGRCGVYVPYTPHPCHAGAWGGGCSADLCHSHW